MNLSASNILLRESTDDCELQPYNVDKVGQCLEYLNKIIPDQNILATLKIDPTDTIGRATRSRLQRSLLIYHLHRLDIVTKSILNNSNFRKNYTNSEIKFSDNLNKLLEEYRHSIDGDGLNLHKCDPPGDLYIMVRCEEDCGIITLEDGSKINLEMGSSHYIKKSPIIKDFIDRGYLIHIR